jgi:hypothetical protein
MAVVGHRTNDRINSLRTPRLHSRSANSYNLRATSSSSCETCTAGERLRKRPRPFYSRARSVDEGVFAIKVESTRALLFNRDHRPGTAVERDSTSPAGHSSSWAVCGKQEAGGSARSRPTNPVEAQCVSPAKIRCRLTVRAGNTSPWPPTRAYVWQVTAEAAEVRLHPWWR